MTMEKPGAGHHPLKMALVIGSVVMFALVCLFNGLNSSLGIQIGLYKSTIGGLSDKYSLQITPTGATFSVWGIIYFWQAAWLVYALTLLCRKYPGGYLYIDPPVIPIPCYGIFMLNLAMNIAWLFAWDREELVVSCLLLYGIPVTLWIIFFIMCYEFPKAANALVAGGNNIDIWLVRLFFHNGIAIYAGWTTVASNLNLATAIIYLGGLSNDVGSSICLGVLTAEILAVYILENWIFEKHFRYIFAHYITLLAGAAGSYVKNAFKTASTLNSYWITILMSFIVCVIVCKIIRSVYMHIKHPMYRGSVENSECDLKDTSKDKKDLV